MQEAQWGLALLLTFFNLWLLSLNCACFPLKGGGGGLCFSMFVLFNSELMLLVGYLCFFFPALNLEDAGVALPVGLSKMIKTNQGDGCNCVISLFVCNLTLLFLEIRQKIHTILS